MKSVRDDHANNIVLWNDDRSDEMHSFWIQRRCDNCWNNMQIFEILPRREAVKHTSAIVCCHTKSLFTREHSSTGERYDRSRLFYSLARVRGIESYFTCKLLAKPANSLCVLLIGSMMNNAHLLTKKARNILKLWPPWVSGSIHQVSLMIVLLKNFGNELRKWRQIVHCIVGVLKFISECSLSVRDRNEIVGLSVNGNCMGIID